MNNPSQKKTALITGASKGIGFATTNLLLSRGYRVRWTSRDRSRLETLAMHNQEKFLALDLDVTSDNSVATILERLPPEWQKINVLLNNVGSNIGGRRNFHEGECRDWLNTIFTGPFSIVTFACPDNLSIGGFQIKPELSPAFFSFKTGINLRIFLNRSNTIFRRSL